MSQVKRNSLVLLRAQLGKEVMHFSGDADVNIAMSACNIASLRPVIVIVVNTYRSCMQICDEHACKFDQTSHLTFSIIYYINTICDITSRPYGIGKINN